MQVVHDDPSPQFIDQCIDSDMDASQTTFPFIPPDPPTSIIAITNTEIELCHKTGDSNMAPTPLAMMFGRPLHPPNVFDPKILYDVHQQQFIVVVFDPNQSTFSSILMALFPR
jgi:hypothetical protein